MMFEKPTFLSDERTMAAVIILTVVCTLFGFTLQPLAQKRTTAEHAGVLCALSPLFASFFSKTLLNETFHPAKTAGLVMILSAVVIINLGEIQKKQRLQTDCTDAVGSLISNSENP